jgi:hypothetical protein
LISIDFVFIYEPSYLLRLKLERRQV